jgi:hypothetical protein
MCENPDIVLSTSPFFCCHGPTACMCHYQLFQANGCNPDIDLSNCVQDIEMSDSAVDHETHARQPTQINFCINGLSLYRIVMSSSCKKKWLGI